MRKILFILIVIFAGSTGIASAGQIEANVVNFNIVIDGEPQIICNSMVSINNRTYLSVRETAELLDLYVVWDDENKIIKISDIGVIKDQNHEDVLLDTDIVNADITDFQVQAEGYVQRLENPVIVIDDTAYLPLREIGQLFHLTVDWIEYSKTIILETEKNEIGNELLLPFNNDGLWGFMNQNGDVVIAPQYTWVSHFSEGLAAVANKEKYIGYIDRQGNAVIPHIYSSGKSFSEGLAYVEIKNNSEINALQDLELQYESYYVDKNGTPIIAEAFADAGEFHDGFAVISKGNHYLAYIDKKGEHVYESNTEYLESFKNGYAVIEDSHGYKKILNTKFERLTGYETYINAFVVPGSDGIAKLVVAQNEAEKYGITDLYGEIIIPFEYDSLDVYFEEGMIIAQKYGKFGVIDFSNHTVIDFQYDFIGCYGEEMFVFANILTDHQRAGFININGDIVIAPDYVAAEEFINGTAIVYTQLTENQDILAIIDKEGKHLKELIIEGMYSVKRYPNGIISIHKPNGYCYLNSRGEEIIPKV